MRPFAALLLPVLLASCAPEPLPPPPPPPPPPPLGPSAPSLFHLPTSPALEALRDPRRLGPPRPRALVITELQGLESLFSSTRPDAPDRPKLMRRLAEGYVELASTAERDRATKIVLAARHNAIRYYTDLVRTYPAFCAGQTTGCADEATYLLGLEYERSGQIDNARKVYLQVLGNYPTSRYVPYAYLAFGELFLPEVAVQPSHLSLAQRSYEEVIKAPPPDNPLYGYALLRLAQIYALLGRADDARFRREQLRDLAAKSPGWAPAEIPVQLLENEAP